MITLINTQTLKVMDDVDESQLREHGMPEGYSLATDFTTEDWLKLLKLIPPKNTQSCQVKAGYFLRERWDVVKRAVSLLEVSDEDKIKLTVVPGESD